jgi:FAD/FMN-containing dehydrogenase
MYGAHYTF